MKKLLLCTALISGLINYLFSQEIPGKNDTIQPGEQEKQGIIFSFFQLDDLKRKGPEDKKWLLSIGGWYERKTGNTDALISNFTSQILYDDNITRLSLMYKRFYNESKGAAFVNNWEAIAEFDRYIAGRFELFMFSQIINDKILKLDLRNNTGAGIKLVLLRKKYLLADLSGAPIYQYEKYENKKAANDLFSSFRFRIKIMPVAFFSVHFNYFYIPYYQDIGNFSSAGEYRTVMDTFAEINFARFSCRDEDGKHVDCKQESGIYFKIGYLQKFNNTPALGTKKKDNSFYAQITLKI